MGAALQASGYFRCGTVDGGSILFCNGSEVQDIKVGPTLRFPSPVGDSADVDLSILYEFARNSAAVPHPADSKGVKFRFSYPQYLTAVGSPKPGADSAFFIEPFVEVGGAAVSGRTPSGTCAFGMDVGYLIYGIVRLSFSVNPPAKYCSGVPGGLGVTAFPSLGVGLAVGTPVDFAGRSSGTPPPAIPAPPVTSGPFPVLVPTPAQNVNGSITAAVNGRQLIIRAASGLDDSTVYFRDASNNPVRVDPSAIVQSATEIRVSMDDSFAPVVTTVTVENSSSTVVYKFLLKKP